MAFIPYRSTKCGRSKRSSFLFFLSLVFALPLAIGADDTGTECRVEEDGTRVCEEPQAPKMSPPSEQKIVIAGDRSVDAAEVKKMKADKAKRRAARVEKEALMAEIRATVEGDADLVAAATSPSDDSEMPKAGEKSGDEDGSHKKPKDKGPSPGMDSENRKGGSTGDGDGKKKDRGDKRDKDFWDQFKKDNPELISQKINLRDLDKAQKEGILQNIAITPPPAEQQRLFDTPYEDGGLLVSNPTTGRAVVIKKQRNDGNEVEKEGTIKVQDDMVKYLRDVVLFEDEYSDMYKKCVNNNELCAFWTYMGECYMNPDYMIRDRFCLLACRQCDKHPDFRGKTFAEPMVSK